VIPDLDALVAFVEVVERGGFTAAARRLGVSTSIVSRRVARLETALDTRLIERSTRGLAPTAAGHAFHQRCRGLLGELQDACEQAAAAEGEVAGVLRITAPASFMRTLVMPVVAQLARAHARLTLDIHLDDGRLNLLQEGFDLAIRAGTLADSDLLCRHLCRVEGVVVASPAYLAHRQRPKQPADLRHHVGLDHSALQPGRLWQFTATDAVAFERRILVNDLEALLELALAGVGVAALPVATATPAIQDGALQVLMARHRLVPHELTALYPASRKDMPKLKALVEALVAHTAQPQARWTASADEARGLQAQASRS